MGLKNFLDGQIASDLYQASLSKGDVFLGKYLLLD